MDTRENITDHDLLIELRTEMRCMMVDLKNLSDGITLRVSNLEQNKLDKTDADRETLRILNLTESKVKEIFNTKTDEYKDHETRIRKVEEQMTRVLTWGSVGLVVLAVVQFLINKFL